VSVPGAVLSLHAVRKRFGGVVALDGVDLELRPGEIHGLVGQNGAGKSTIMKLLSGAYSGYEGEIRVGAEVCRFSSPADAQARGIAMVYQELSTFAHLSVAENIFGGKLPVRGGLVSWRAANRIAAQHLAELGLDLDVTSTMGTLPVGQQQLVEIARVVFSGARTIILDEPTSALSHPETRRLFDFMRALKAQGKALVFISHFLDDVVEICDRITVLKNGRRVSTLAAEAADKQGLIELMIGRDAASLNQSYATGAPPAARTSAPSSTPASSPVSPAAEVMRVEHLWKRGAFTDVSFTLRSGEILGCFAFMGAGQTQLGRCLFGAERADGGTVHQDGKVLRLTSTTRARAAGIAFVPEDRRHALMMSKEIFKNITIAHLARLLPWWLREPPELAIADVWMKRVGVRPLDARLPVGALSGGNQQKVVLAKWLTHTPRVLLLNEPTRGMDVEAKEEVLGVIRRLRDAGGSALLISTEPETILSVADRALVMSKGKLTAELGGTALTKENLMRHA
jgi:ribose transport system ATP-binding protein